MASSTIRKAIGVVKDQTSISIAKVAGNVAPDLEVLIVKATGHDNEPAEEKYTREILNLTSYSRSYVSACVYTLSKRLSKTHDWIVALKALMLIHRLLVDGEPAFGQEIMYASRKGTRVLNMSDFHDEAHSNSWEHSAFVKTYAMYLAQKLEFIASEQKLSGINDTSRFEDGYRVNQVSRSYDDLKESVRQGDRKDIEVVSSVWEMKTEEVLERLHQLLRLLDRVLSCRPTGNVKNSRMVLIALHLVLKESFRVYADMFQALGVLLDRFSQLEYAIGVKAFDESVYAAKTIDEIVGFYSWCKDLGVARSSEFPKVQKITDELLGGLERVLREKKNVEKNKEIESLDNESETLPNMNEIKALPPPENHNPPPSPPPAAALPPQPTEDLLNLKDDVMSADAHGNKLALSLFSAPSNVNTNGSWEAFSEPEVTSAWQILAAEGGGEADWEVALVESASNLPKQKANMAGGLDSLLLNGMYDHGAVRQHMSNSQVSGGSSSSFVMPGLAATPMLALPAPDGTIQSVGPQDPFAASLTIPPPSYVQIADMEKKHNLLMQEQQAWHLYGSSGMQGEGAFAKINAAYSGGMGYQNGYYYAQF
ncbi:probable clathrin assembly protein At4g32285 [Cynara cardunculus var. scolymus]|uniref:AP180 N-terminal homology (ANTH) domain-containing protein n=1 Tax=Cynara cardunculus var. scolymus TaxID=59895 RepID=A0A103YMB5_CYNCS|nr:probable clathrin assembly protein At4g32285 [Cynara cardunculus var. scolymus]KVI11650.1 AP180 N-terminal homology (ANTH) domain-containing protein [Cynara cardunculus var. scolymus]